MKRCYLTFASMLFVVTSAVAQKGGFYDIDTVQKISLSFQQTDWRAQLKANYTTKNYIKADITINGTTLKDIGVRFRGNSSYFALPSSSEKQSYKIALDAFVAGQNYQGYSTLNINNNFMDPTWVRETVGYYLFRQFTPGPQSNYCALTINGNSFGPFVNTEQMNTDFNKKWFASKDGNRYRGEPVAFGGSASNRGLIYLGTDSAAYAKAYQLKNENAATPWTDLIKVCDLLNNSGTAITTKLPPVLDVGNAMRMNAGAVVFLWLDSYMGSYCHNFYLYADSHHGLMHVMPWDMNNIFGGLSDGNSRTNLINLALNYRATQSTRPLQYRLLAVPEWQADYYAYAREISKLMRWDYLGPVIQRFQNAVAAEAAKDPKRLYVHTAFASNLTTDLYATPSLVQPIRAIKPIVDGRATFLKSAKSNSDPICSISDLRHAPAEPTVNDAVQITAKVVPPAGQAIGEVAVYWRIKGAYIKAVMYDDGKNGDGKAADSVFGVSLGKQPINSVIDYYLRATTNSSTAWNAVFAPALGNHQPHSALVYHPRGGPAIRINEVLAKNTKTNQDEKQQFEDWIELYNAGGTSIDVSGMHLTDDRALPTKWKLPATPKLGPGQTLLIWCDNDTNQGSYHANFKLDGDGEWVGLFDSTGTVLVDDLQFGPQADDTSTGAMADGGAQRVSLLDPSPNTPNALAKRSPACGLLRYSNLDPAAHPLRLSADTAPKPGITVNVKVENSTASAPVIVVVGGAPAYFPLGEQIVLLNLPPILTIATTTDAAGTVSVPAKVPNLASLAGLELYLQAAANTGSGALVLSNGLAGRVCPK